MPHNTVILVALIVDRVLQPVLRGMVVKEGVHQRSDAAGDEQDCQDKLQKNDAPYFTLNVRSLLRN